MNHDNWGVKEDEVSMRNVAVVDLKLISCLNLSCSLSLSLSLAGIPNNIGPVSK